MIRKAIRSYVEPDTSHTHQKANAFVSVVAAAVAVAGAVIGGAVGVLVCCFAFTTIVASTAWTFAFRAGFVFCESLHAQRTTHAVVHAMQSALADEDTEIPEEIRAAMQAFVRQGKEALSEDLPPSD